MMVFRKSLFYVVKNIFKPEGNQKKFVYKKNWREISRNNLHEINRNVWYYVMAKRVRMFVAALVYANVSRGEYF